MKKFLVGFGLPAVAAIAVIGSGFSVWAFDKETKSQDVAGIEVTQLVKVGTFNQASGSTLVLNQTSNDFDDKSISGVYLDKFTGTDATKEIKYLTSGSDSIAHTVKVEIKTYIFLSNALADYVTVEGAAAYNEDYSFDTTTYAKTAFKSFVYTWGDGVTSINLPSVGDRTDAAFTFKYVDGQEPTDETKYNAMKAAVTADGVKAVFVSEAKLVKAD